MAGIKRFEEIQAWQKAREMVREVYGLCRENPLGKDFGLRDQICRASVSAMSNIAEGFAKGSNRDFAHFLDIARGSAIEVQSLLYVALDVRHIGDEDFRRLYRLAEDTISLVAGFTAYLRKTPSNAQPIGMSSPSRSPKSRAPNSAHRTPNSELQTQNKSEGESPCP